MKRFYHPLTLFPVLLAFGIIISAAPSLSSAQPLDEAGAPAPLPQEQVVLPASPEPWAASGHPVGDTIARGIDFLLTPVYGAGACAWFSVFEPPDPRSITELTMINCPPDLQTLIAPEPPAPSPQPAPSQPSAPQPPALDEVPAPSQQTPQ
jgi:hypothetical protein